jgi:ribosomal protein S6E (S10)
LASRTAWAGTATTEVFDVADANSLPGGWIGYAETTSTQTGITGETDLTGLSQAVTVNSSRRIKIIGYLPNVAASAGSGNRSRLRIKEGSTVLQDIAYMHTGTGNEGPAKAMVVLTPSSGSHTYKLSLQAQDTGNTNQNADSDSPAFILIEDMGPSS